MNTLFNYLSTQFTIFSHLVLREQQLVVWITAYGLQAFCQTCPYDFRHLLKSLYVLKVGDISRLSGMKDFTVKSSLWSVVTIVYFPSQCFQVDCSVWIACV